MRVKKICVMLGLLLVVACGAWGGGSQNGDYRWTASSDGEWGTASNWQRRSGAGSGTWGTSAYVPNDPNQSVFITVSSDITINISSDISIKDLRIEASNGAKVTLNIASGVTLNLTGGIYIGNTDTPDETAKLVISGNGLVSADSIQHVSNTSESSISLENNGSLTVRQSVNNISAGQQGSFSITGDGTGTFDYQGSANVDSFMNVDTSALANSSGNFFVATNEFRWTGAVDSDWTKAGNWEQKGTIGSTVSYSPATRYPGSQDGDTADFTAATNEVNVTNFIKTTANVQ